MNKKFQILLMAMLVINNANALTKEDVNAVQVEKEQVENSNAYEKSITPLLRDFSKRKTELELDRLDLEREKLKEELYKLKNNGQSSNMPTSTIPSATSTIPSATSLVGNSSILQEVTSSSISVVMIYGFENELYAKVTMGNQGGFPVKKGDILPDGRYVQNVYSNYIEVKDKKTKNSKIEKIYLSAPQSGSKTEKSTETIVPTTPPTM